MAAVEHDRLVDVEGKWLCSYEELLRGREGYHVVSRDGSFVTYAGRNGSATDATERLVLNFAPSTGGAA